MLIVNRDELATMPSGTVFMKFPDGNIYVKMKSELNMEGSLVWYGELPLRPFYEEFDNNEYGVQWCVTDNTYYDCNYYDKFFVFSKTEVQQMINCLQWALTDCESYFNQDIWFVGDRMPYTDEEWEFMKNEE